MGQWVQVGETRFVCNTPMTVDNYGLGKLSTSATLSLDDAGIIGVNAVGQLLARKANTSYYGSVKLSEGAAIIIDSDDYTQRGGQIGMADGGQIYAVTGTVDRFGAVRLGSKYQPTNAMPYVVGIGASTNEGKVGQLAFNLRTAQSDGTPGCLKYKLKDGKTNEYEMFVEEASASQMGICRLITSLTGYTDEEIEAMRDTCAASVGLVKDTVDTYVTDFCNDARISGYFETWANGKDLASQIWNNEEMRGSLETYLSEYVDSSSVFQNVLETKVSTWLAGTITDDYIYSMFSGKAEEICKAAVDEHWTEDLELAIDEAAERTAEKHTESRVLAYLSNPSNLGTLSEVIKSSSLTEILEAARDSAEEGAAEYVRQVFDGETMITIDEAKTYFADYAKAQMQAIADALTTAVETRLSTVEAKLARLTSPTRYSDGSYGTWTKITYMGGWTSYATLDVNKYSAFLFRNDFGEHRFVTSQEIRGMFKAQSGECRWAAWSGLYKHYYYFGRFFIVKNGNDYSARFEAVDYAGGVNVYGFAEKA